MLIETITLSDKYDFELYYSDLAEHLLDDLWDNVNFVSNRRDFHSTVDRNLDDLIGEDGKLLTEIDGLVVVPVFGYEHGSIALSLGEFGCKWDSGLFGVLLFEKGEFGENNQGLKGFIRGWCDLINGNVYDYIIIEKVKCECCDNVEREVIDSCAGFYGHESRQDMLDCMKEYIELDQELLDKIK